MKNMLKPTLLAISVLALLSNHSHAAQILSETFTYADGNLVGNSTWAAHSGAAATPIQVGTGAITLALGGGSREDVNILPSSGLPLAAGGTLYSSFDVTVTGAAAVSSATYFAHFFPTTGSFVYESRVFVTSSSGSDFTFALGSSSTPSQTWATGLTFGETYTVVTSYDFDTGASKIWVDPTSELSTSLSLTGSIGNGLEGYALRQAAGSSSLKIDNLVLATSFADLSAVPEPSSTAALAGLVVLGAVATRRRRA